MSCTAALQGELLLPTLLRSGATRMAECSTPARSKHAPATGSEESIPFVCSVAALRVRNTFLDDGEHQRSRSLEPFFRERLVRSCPVSPAKDELAVEGEECEIDCEVASVANTISPMKDFSPCPWKAGDLTGTTRFPSDGSPDFHLDPDSPLQSLPLASTVPASSTGGCQYSRPTSCMQASAAAFVPQHQRQQQLHSVPAPAQRPLVCAPPMHSASTGGYMMYPPMASAMNPWATSAPVVTMPSVMPAPRSVTSTQQVLSLADAIDAPFSSIARAASSAPSAPAVPPPKNPPSAPPSSPPSRAASKSQISATASQPLAPPPTQPPQAAAETPERDASRTPPSPPSGFAPGSAELPSIGSEGHAAGTCKPCAFFHTAGCTNGVACQFCHLCDAEEKKRRRKEKIQAKRLASKLRLEEEGEEGEGEGDTEGANSPDSAEDGGASVSSQSAASGESDVAPAEAAAAAAAEEAPSAP